MIRTLAWLSSVLGLIAAAGAAAYPGGTPSFQTDVAPFCSACHSSLTESALEGAGERATKELAENKHLAAILAGQRGYAELSPDDRARLAEQVRAVDANSKIELEFPPQVAKGETFQVKANVTGGAGPVVGVGLVDRPHRWFARPASAAGWTVVGAPTVIGDDGQPQQEWLSRRPESLGRGITFVNVTGIHSDAVAGKWAKAKVIFTLKAPDRAGDFPLVGAFWYGTEKASPLGYETNALGQKQVRGGYTGGSGRVRFTDAHVITVK
jgi:hypothetical protein